ncbi:MAG: hypothetical protein V3W41_06845 [Planctomycetota bacterium]
MTSGSNVNLVSLTTHATLTSDREINDVPTSFTPFTPEFSAPLSTATVTVGGEYGGQQGDDVLTVVATVAGDVGVGTGPKFGVLDGLGNQVDVFSLGSSYVPGEAITLSNGLELSFEAGFVQQDDSFDIEVSTAVPSAVDSSAAFNGTGANNPNFEPGVTVTAGSIEINGTTINVAANDSIDTLLQKISTSNAKVNASYNAQTERIELISQIAGSAGDIVLGTDTTGFFAATKLDTGISTAGNDGFQGDVDSRIADISSLNGISSGTFEVNGVTLNVDVDNDSLQDVIDTINASGAGVTASYDAENADISIVSNSGGSIVLGDGTSDLFSVLDVSTGVSISPRRNGGNAGNPQVISDAFENITREFNRLFSDLGGVSPLQRNLANIDFKGAIRGAFQQAFGEFLGGDELDTGIGIVFDFSDDADELLRFDESEFRSSLRSKSVRASQFLGDEKVTGGRGGLATRFADAIKRIEDRVQDRLGILGGVLDILA